MAYLDVKTRYDFPEDRDQRFPEEVPWDVPISELPGFSLSINCCKGMVVMPLRLMAANHGWKLTLRSIVPKLKCDVCHNRPERIVFVPRNSGDGHSSGRGREHVLRG